MISSLVCQLQVIVVSTVALERLSRAYDKEVSVEAFMRRYFDLEWIAVRLNFFVGVLSFVTAIGLRAWQTVRRAASFPSSLAASAFRARRTPSPRRERRVVPARPRRRRRRADRMPSRRKDHALHRHLRVTHGLSLRTVERGLRRRPERRLLPAPLPLRAGDGEAGAAEQHVRGRWTVRGLHVGLPPLERAAHRRIYEFTLNISIRK